MYTGVSSPETSLFRLIKCASSCFISACCVHLRLFLAAADTSLPSLVLLLARSPCGRHCSASSDACMFDLLTFFFFLPPRGAGGGDGEPGDGGPPRETETPAQTQRALPVPPARVFTGHTHQVRCCTPPCCHTAT